ncbi:MAG: arginase family protein [Nanoarchaeota archaeon]
MNLLKIPFNAGALEKKQGIEQAPDMIVHALKSIHLSESGILPVFNIEEVKVDNTNIEESRQLIQRKVNLISFPCIILGGDHSITYPCFSAFAKTAKNPGIVIFDAHPDLMDSRNTHEDYLRNLIDEKVVKPSNVLLVGIRAMHPQEISYMKKQNINNFSMKEISFKGVQESCDSIMEVARVWDALYLSIDIDVLDPAFAPGTGYHEPGGLTTRELVYFCQRLKLLKNLKLIDIVEVNPEKDLHGHTMRIAAKLVMELS